MMRSCADTVDGDADELCVVVVLKFPAQLQSLSLELKVSCCSRISNYVHFSFFCIFAGLGAYP
uniref:Uncharacterized protein n=1 Tax=Arundo donax TaxID=35708 RepID=A0A0A9GYU3_ARUDO